MMTGNLSVYRPQLRTDPLSRMAILTLPEDSLAILPLLQEQSELDLHETFNRDVPYSPSFVLSLPEVSENIRNLSDLHFLPGFHSPTLAILYSPVFTWAGRYKTVRDTFVLEIRTIDLSGGSYPRLSSVTGLPSDSLYLVPCPAELGGVVLVTETGILHIEQSGRIVATSVNGWWEYITNLKADRSFEHRKLSLEGSKCIFVAPRDMLLIMHNGDVHQVRFEMDGRSVGSIKIDEQSSSVPPPSSLVIAGEQALFVASAEGDSLLAKVDLEREVVEEEEKKESTMDVDWDEDLYGDINAPTADGNQASKVASGPANVRLSPYDVLTGVGQTLDIEFGIALTDQGVSAPIYGDYGADHSNGHILKWSLQAGVVAIPLSTSSGEESQSPNGDGSTSCQIPRLFGSCLSSAKRVNGSRTSPMLSEVRFCSAQRRVRHECSLYRLVPLPNK